MKPSKIGWTDYSGGDLNFVTGCTPVSRGCAHCYARAIYERYGKDFTVTEHPRKLYRLLTQSFGRESIKNPGHLPMAFVVNTGDLFHPEVSDSFIEAALTVMGGRRDVTWQVLTKRSGRMRDYLSEHFPNPARNIWWGVSVEDQETANERIPMLMGTPAALRFVSVEPMLEFVNLYEAMFDVDSVADLEGDNDLGFIDGLGHGIDWAICGAESGPNRRPFDRDWAANLCEQCEEGGIPFFGKQDSGLRPGEPLLIKGREVKEWPN